VAKYIALNPLVLAGVRNEAQLPDIRGIDAWQAKVELHIGLFVTKKTVRSLQFLWWVIGQSFTAVRSHENLVPAIANE
jgi:hypothetical protein